jgi:hypothetical protein
MSLFYLLPPRPIVGDRLVSFLQTLLPGLDWNVQERRELADVLIGLAGRREDVFLVHREDLPHGESVARALADGFGAEEGDEVVEVRLGLRGELTSRRSPTSPAQRSGTTAMEPVSET